MQRSKIFWPETIIGWITLLTLGAGIIASLYGSIVKPYNFMLDLERRLTLIEYKLTVIEKAVK